jgi:two-component system chemotaxis sensor kinase CheA
VVDQLLHQQEMVIKPLGTILSSVPCIAGGSVLGNGDVALVIDVPELEERFRMRHLSAHHASA